MAVLPQRTPALETRPQPAPWSLESAAGRLIEVVGTEDTAVLTLAAQFLLDAIAEKEKVSVGQPELIEYLVMSAQRYGMDPNEFAKAVDEGGQIPEMVAEVARRKALAAVLDKAKVVDSAGNDVSLKDLDTGDVNSSPGAFEFEEVHDHDDHERLLGCDSKCYRLQLQHPQQCGRFL